MEPDYKRANKTTFLQGNGIRKVDPNPEVEIHLANGQTLAAPRGTPVGKFLQAIQSSETAAVVGAIINGELRELTYPIEMESRVAPVTMADADGARIYRRSITFLLEAVFSELFPGGYLTVDHSVSSGGYFCQVVGRQPLSVEEIALLEERMRSKVNDDLPFERETVPLQEAIDYFQSTGQFDKVRLLTYRQKDHLVLYRLGGHRDYHHGYMVPSTGYLDNFSLILMGAGFILRYPRRHQPNAILPMPEYPKLLAAFRQYGDWLTRLGIDSVGALNDAIRAGRIQEVILVQEALHEQQIAEAAESIANHRESLRVILISGPSSSGKTTFSKRLAVQLLAQGLSPFALEMDNYFVDREHTPLDENGNYDYESFDALNREILNEDLKHLILGEKVRIPHYNFRLGVSEPGEEILIRPDQLVILEGIHGLNPNLLPEIPADQTFRIYVSCLTQINLDRHNRISTTDTRLIRRIIRDARERGYTAQQTIRRWESVRRGEKRHIFPYQENADLLFNSALAYEIPAMKPLVEPLLRQVPFGTPEYIEAKRLLAFLEWFQTIPPEPISDNSILREFIGGSILKEFKVWQG